MEWAGFEREKSKIPTFLFHFCRFLERFGACRTPIIIGKIPDHMPFWNRRSIGLSCASLFNERHF